MRVSPEPAPGSASGPLEQYRRHRELLLREVPDFAESLKGISDRLVANLFESHGYKTGVFLKDAPDLPPYTMEAGQLARRQRERLEFEVGHDSAATSFQRRWRVLLVAQHSPTIPDVHLSFVDDFFLEPLITPGSAHDRLSVLYPERFVIVDREAGRNPVEEALTKKLKNRPKGEVSRLPSKPPFDLQARPGRDFVKEDVELVRVCANGNLPEDFAELVVERLYRSLARAAGWARGRRLKNYAPTDDAKEWMRRVRSLRKRWRKIERVLGPFNDA